MKIGQNQIETGNGFRKRLRVREIPTGGNLVCRIVTGPIERHFHMWPTFAEDATTQIIKPTWRSAYVDPDIVSPLEKLANVDKACKEDHLKTRAVEGTQAEKARSVLSRQNRFDYVVIPRVQGQKAELSILEANWTVFSAINKLSSAPHPVTPGMLLNGLQYMFDIVITKGTHEKTRRPDYSVSILSATTQGTISTNHLDEEKYPIENPGQYFSQDDLALITAADWELETEDVAMSPEKLMKFLREYPIDFKRTEKKNPGTFMFFNNEEDYNKLVTYASKNELFLTDPTNTQAAQIASQPVTPPPGVAPTQQVVQPVVIQPVAEVVQPVVIQPVAEVVQPVVIQPVAEVVQPVVIQPTPVAQGVVQPAPAENVQAVEVGITRPNEQAPVAVPTPVGAPEPVKQAADPVVAQPVNVPPITQVATEPVQGVVQPAPAPEGALKKPNIW